ncbi:GDP/GTP exchange factor Sec2p-domain-containing protein [Radiomyces spectabilis]|uniref:GDP/GTP exchange factor Sec2p-domain-containing protein n=1 Tax=Radiomyces spectabilis TaxID=64574 RepID=UPI00221EFFB1|nr:GDP/GTP exchange factor Sec2p-domain-containing protein [Radiomyces spectabilis]KAI8376409.1 GDP/GTP exchange factor Sec2p-domain-containing protein [Radiomyces spectabilis]
MVTPPRTSAESTEEPSRSSPSTADCPCHHILISKDSKYCALCDRPIPILEELQKERDAHEREIRSLQVQLTEEQAKIAQQIEEIEKLNATIENVERQLDIKTEEFRALQNDMELLNDKYVDEIERVAEIQHSKDMVESELEDLSRRLFEEANGMVANEKREKYHLEVAQRQLENQLKETREHLVAEQMQLKELRQKMESMGQQPASSPVEKSQDNDIMSPEGCEQQAVKDLASLFSDRLSSTDISSAGIDQMMLDEFQELVRLGTTAPLKKLHTVAFMKNCQVEDVEPCLRFGPNSRLSARKINEAIVMNTCFIEEAPPGFAEEQAKRPADMPLKISASKSMIWERFSGGNSQNGPFAGCQACGRSDLPLPYRCRISYFDDWACIDRYCRDRLVAVCEFYVFIRNVRQGYYNSRTIPDLYHECMRLRLQMFYARMGALSWTLGNLGIKGDTIGSASAIKMQIPPPSSESSPLPRTTTPKASEVPRRGSVDVKPVASDEPNTPIDNSNATTEAQTKDAEQA